MPVEILKRVIIGIKVFVEVKGMAMSSTVGDLHSSLLQATQKHHSHQVMQQHIWRLFTLFCQRDQNICESLLSAGILDSTVILLQCEGSYFSSAVDFLSDCCQRIGGFFVTACLEKGELMKQTCLKLSADETATKFGIETLSSLCRLVAILCAKCDPGMVSQIMEHDCVSVLEKCARKWPVSCVLPACIAIEGIVKRLRIPSNARNTVPVNAHTSLLLAKKQTFTMQNHHTFVKDMLRASSINSLNS